ncbi:HNH endonuclease signature motif containing protein [Tahibacter harae]|uniref:HNH endonuclease n=1 Tax=Tahibacter harae TaxID=2963937 RepID=A0ABT1QS31_9GAMM|nr:HNH endonuclease signature motif containing protein [Tahibacter harae]MCQ4165103.1 HNH endonuclease [Tahibacter harae]
MKPRPNHPKAWAAKDRDLVLKHFADTPTAELARRLGRPAYQVSQCAARMGLKKSAAYLASPAACRLRRGDGTGSATRFRPGQEPWNTGKKGWQAGGRSVQTQFKPGHRSGRAAAIYQPVGAERISKDGIRQRKVNDDMPFQGRWKAVHAINWEAANGPIPKGYLVVFRDGNRDNVALENLELISRSENLRRNSLHRFPKELVSLCQLKGAVTRQLNKRARK